MIPETEPVKNHYGNNVATQFDFDFYIEDESQLQVTHTDLNGFSSVLVWGIDYTINEIGNEAGSYINFPIQGSKYKVLAWDETTNKKELLSVALNLPFEQGAEYGKSHYLNLNSIEKSFDYVTRLTQILKRKLKRAVMVPEGSSTFSPEELLNSINNAQKNTQEFAAAAEQKALEAEKSSNTATEQADIATEKATEIQEMYNIAMNDLGEEHSIAVSEIKNTAKFMLEKLKGVPFIPFCFNSGPVGKNGEATLLEYHEGIVDEELKKVIVLKTPAVYTDGCGKTTIITEDLLLDVTDFEPGIKYSLRTENIDGVVNFFAVKNGEIYRQKSEPKNPSAGDIWQNQSIAPELAYIRTENNTWEITNQVEAGKYTVPDLSGGGGSLMTNPYNYKPGASGSSLPIGTILTLPATANCVPNNTVYISQPSLLYSGVQGGDNDMFYQLYQEYLTGDNPKLKTLSMADYETEITEKGYCDSFGIDTETQTFKMPHIPRGMVTGSKDAAPVIGTDTAITLTNGTEYFGLNAINAAGQGAVAAFKSLAYTRVGTVNTAGYDVKNGALGYSKDITKPSGEAVLSEALKQADVGYYMVVSNGSIDTDQIEATWSNYMSSLNGKANINANNFSQEGKEEIVNWLAPDYSAGISFPIPISTASPVVTPSAGWLYTATLANTYGRPQLIYASHNSDMSDAYIILSQNWDGSGNTVIQSGWIFLEKGIYLRRGNTVTQEHDTVKFYPMKGVSNA